MPKEGSLGLSTDCRIIRFGRGLEDILGHTEAEICGKELSVLIDPGDAPRFKALIEAAKSASRGITGEKAHLVGKDGHSVEFYISIFPLRERSGEIHSIMLNLSTEETTEVPAILSNEFQRIFRFANDAVAITDVDANIIDVNNAFLDIYGYEKLEVLGHNPRLLKSTHSTKEQYEKMWRDILDPDKGYWKGELVNVAKDGREVPVLLSINAIRDEGGEIKNFLSIALDMTKEKELDTLKRMYIDYIVHDMRGPLTSIMANSEILMMYQQGNPDASVKRKLTQIFVCAEKISSMTNDILDYSRAGRGILPINKARVSLKKILRDAIQPFEASQKAFSVNGVPYDGDALPELELEADPDKLQRILYNLLNNAFKYADEEVSVDWTVEGKVLKFTVTNDGESIKKEEAERVFDAFFQTDEGVKTGGAGLGLCIVKTFVEAHNGTVWIEPGKSRGTTVGFRIPV
jgi:PAS domain S-box-containing protein